MNERRGGELVYFLIFLSEQKPKTWWIILCHYWSLSSYTHFHCFNLRVTDVSSWWSEHILSLIEADADRQIDFSHARPKPRFKTVQWNARPSSWLCQTCGVLCFPMILWGVVVWTCNPNMSNSRLRSQIWSVIQFYVACKKISYFYIHISPV